MPRKNRNILQGIVCHHMVEGINREYIFKTDDEKKKYYELLKKYYSKYEIYIIAYCIMDNHVHMLLYSEKINNISNFMRQVNSIYAMDYNKKKNRVGYVYRNRFKSVPIMSREQMYICIKYIHMNPVKAGIVKKEGEYKYSSYNDFLNQTGFVNQEILEFVFNSSKNYIDIFKKIEYKILNINKEKCNINKVFNEFLLNEKMDFNKIRKNKEEIIKFINYLKSNKYEYTKSDIAEILQISRTTLYRRLYDKKSVEKCNT